MLELDKDDRLKLLKFVCTFAWTDLKVTAEERQLVLNIMDSYEFDQAERAQVAKWLKVPPPAEEVDPMSIPTQHRRLFVDAARATVEADGRVVPSELESLAIFEELLQQ